MIAPLLLIEYVTNVHVLVTRTGKKSLFQILARSVNCLLSFLLLSAENIFYHVQNIDCFVLIGSDSLDMHKI